jgi:hypothetical protein
MVISQMNGLITAESDKDDDSVVEVIETKEASSTSKLNKLFTCFDSNFNEPEFEEDSNDKVKDEFSRYLKEKQILLENTGVDGKVTRTNPLHWWKYHQETYPLLATLAKKYLCIPATSAPAERLFSKAGLTITDKRNQLNADLAGDLIFLKENWEVVESFEESS